MIFGEIESFVSLLERIIKPLKKKSKEVTTEQTELISTRFVRIFEAHGVHRNQIPRVIGCGLTLYDVQSDENLLKKIDEEILQKTCDVLGVKRDWLEGASKQIYPTYDFYKEPYAFKKFLENKLAATNEQLTGVLLSPNKKDNFNTAVLIIQETVGNLDSSPYYRYFICNNWDFSYWKSRVYLTACVAICWKNRVYIHGKSLTNETINSLAWGCNILNFGTDGIYDICGQSWYAEDMASSPETFLQDLDPEHDNYGIRTGLQFWLELHHEGLMNYGVPDVAARVRFVDELQKYT